MSLSRARAGWFQGFFSQVVDLLSGRRGTASSAGKRTFALQGGRASRLTRQRRSSGRDDGTLGEGSGDGEEAQGQNHGGAKDQPCAMDMKQGVLGMSSIWLEEMLEGHTDGRRDDEPHGSRSPEIASGQTRGWRRWTAVGEDEDGEHEARPGEGDGDEEPLPDSPLPGLSVSIDGMEVKIGQQIAIGQDTHAPTVLHLGTLRSDGSEVVLKVSCPQPRVVGISRRPAKPRIRPGLQPIAKITKVPDNRRWALFDSEEHRRAAAESGEAEAALLGRMQGTYEGSRIGVVRLIGAGLADVAGEAVYIQILECAGGGTLLDYLGASMESRNKRGLPLEETKRIMRAVLKTVAAMHAERICHRDINPENILMMRDESGLYNWVPRLTDFGTAICVPVMSEGSRSPWSCAPAGTYQYLPPEAYDGATWDAEGGVSKLSPAAAVDPFQADVWACGVTLYHLAHGFSPFSDDKSIGEARVARAQYLVRDKLPQDLQDLIRGMMALKGDRLTLMQVLEHSWLR